MDRPPARRPDPRGTPPPQGGSPRQGASPLRGDPEAGAPPRPGAAWAGDGLPRTGGARPGARAGCERPPRARPNSAIYHNNLANALRAARQSRQDAEAAYREALRLDPDYALAAYNLGALKLDRGDLDAARDCLRGGARRRAPRACGGGPGPGGAPRAAGEAGRGRGVPAAARLRAAPEHPDLLSDFGALFRRLGRVEEAIACHERVVALQPDRAGAFNDLGALYQLQGRVESALACFDRALELDAGCGRGALQPRESSSPISRASRKSSHSLRAGRSSGRRSWPWRPRATSPSRAGTCATGSDEAGRTQPSWCVASRRRCAPSPRAVCRPSR